VTPHVREMEGYSGLFEVLGAGAVIVRFWNADSSRQLVLAANLSDDHGTAFLVPPVKFCGRKVPNEQAPS
jgi:hypothetical protein